MPNICKYIGSKTKHSGFTIFKSLELVPSSRRHHSKRWAEKQFEGRQVHSILFLARKKHIDTCQKDTKREARAIQRSEGQYYKTKPPLMGWEGSWSFKSESSFCFCQGLSICLIFSYAFEYLVWALRRRRETMVMIIRLFLLYSVVGVALAGHLWSLSFLLDILTCRKESGSSYWV